MLLKNIINLSDKVEGSYLDVGYGKGVLAREVFTLMHTNNIKRRNLILVDLFEGGEKGIWQKAHDLCNEAQNRLETKGQYKKVNLLTESLQLDDKVAFATYDLGDESHLGLIKVYNALSESGVIIFPNYNSSIGQALSDLGIKDKIQDGVAYKYVVKGKNINIPRLKNTNIKRTRSELT